MTTVIAISGLESSGKTALMVMLSKELGNTEIIHYSRYKSEIDYETYFDWLINQGDDSKVLADFIALRNEINNRLKADNVDYLLIDYPYGYTHKEVSKLLDYVFYLETSLDIVYARHLLTNYKETTTSDILTDARYYIDYAGDLLKLEQEKVKSSANLIVDGNKEMSVKLQVVTDYLIKQSLNNQEKIWQETARNLPTIQTERLLLRKFAYDDVEDILSYASNPLVTKNMDWNGHRNLKESKVYIRDSLTNPYVKEPFIWAIALKDSNRVIGAVSLTIDTTKKHGEIGYLLNPDYWHLGYASESVKQLLAFSFTNLGLTRLFGICLTDNLASANVMLNCGMAYEGTLRNFLEIDSNLRDVALYSRISK
ncbi:GNAT family N-acetyltransferase [Vagococcus intermedius]|uniref:GNAT family N-acetyltransferase n=1 Tax=Vagococcus intermedius TaxID=2991418 RepID=A0AAF0CSY8_9ENTE|nr:GNAT family N-acetyltransferase [Vagococcus intermedius]WEG72399.1 GNAT family N-acetyltransferase [Vagococcus intermedius]WEG74487.1 GNAT family N-acetyltransferase [Vagococcus intermedius]